MQKAKFRLSQLAERVWKGEHADKPYLGLLPHIGSTSRRSPGSFKERIVIKPGFEEESQGIIDEFEQRPV